MGTLRLWLCDGENLVCSDVGESLNGATGPSDLDLLDGRIRAEAEVDTRIAGARVADGSGGFVPLRTAVRRGDFDLCAKAHAVAACADESQEKPVPAGCADVSKQLYGFVETGDHGINAACVEDVSEGRAAMGAGNLEGRAGVGTGIFELAVAEVAKDGVGLGVGLGGDGLLDVIHHVGAGDEEVLPAIVVEVVGAVAPAGHAIGESAEAAGDVRIDEGAAALVDVEREAFMLNGGVPDVGQAVVVDVAEISAHAGESVAVGRVGNTSRDGNLLELFTANVVEKEVGHGVVGDEGGEKATAIDVGEGHCHPFAVEGVDAGFVRDISERAVAVVAIERVVERQVKIGMAISAQAFL